MTRNTVTRYAPTNPARPPARGENGAGRVARDVHLYASMNASNITTRKATELDVGNRVVYDGTIKTIAAISEVFYPGRVVTTMAFTDGTSTMERASAIFVCV